MQQMEKNRLTTADPLIAESLKTVLDTLDQELDTVRKPIQRHIDSDPELKQQRDLLESIPGVGPATSAWLLTLLSPHYVFTHAKQAVALGWPRAKTASVRSMEGHYAPRQNRRPRPT